MHDCEMSETWGLGLTKQEEEPVSDTSTLVQYDSNE